ncbi:winged helix-turn-helix transcriptional regulator [Paenibacillus residui]|uniref:Winged helix-turn-helix transcriptional regulator n=1 Tax=Paenibacillus residui TaxID=629724 RepID=A0ABW3D4U9_9BACL
MDPARKMSICQKDFDFSIISGKWKAMILWHLRNDTIRFCELKKMLQPITQKTLTTQLRELEDDLLVHREVYPVFPAKVEYSLTPHGRQLIPIIECMIEWNKSYKQLLKCQEIQGEQG